MYTYRAELVKIIDGDTITAMIDQGFSNFTEQDLRFILVQTPESGEEDYQYWINYIHRWFDENPNFIVRTVKMKTKDKEQRSFTRYMADILSIDGRSLPAQMIEDGAPLYRR